MTNGCKKLNEQSRKLMNKICIEKPSPKDFPRIGELIYQVDPFIYPPLFGSPEVARETMPALMAIPNSPFAVSHILVARLDNEIAGVSVCYLEPFASTPNLSRFYESGLPVPTSCKDVCERYLIPMCAEVGPAEAYLACIATDKQYRNRGVATALIKAIFDIAGGKSVSLDVLKDNAAAISLYEGLGFRITLETEGYAYNEPAPRVFRMVSR